MVPRRQPAKAFTIDQKMEVAVGLEPTKAGFADQRLDRFGIATKPVLTLCKPCTQLYTHLATAPPDGIDLLKNSPVLIS